MAFQLFICEILMTCIFADVVSASTQGRFPLEYCTGDDADVVYLLSYDIDQSWEQQQVLINYVGWELSHYRSSENNSLWMEATVVDQFSAQDQTINVSGWNCDVYKENNEPYMRLDTEHQEISTKDINTVLEMKIQFVERLFNEMQGVRKKAIHVGVVFLDGTSLTHDELRNVSSILAQRHRDVEIFLVIFGSKLVYEIINLSDTIVLPNKDLRYFDQYLLMAMCKMCGKEWFAFEHTANINMLSCYKQWDTGLKMTWTEAMAFCSTLYSSHLAIIETVEEMQFLQKRFNSLVKEQSAPIAHINIGLRRDLGNYAKRFQWMAAEGRYRPLVISHWLPGKPCRGCINTDCVAWQFTNHRTNESDSVNERSEGWTDVNCHSQIISSIVCEAVLPHRIDYVDFISNMTAPPESINLTLEKGDFMIYENNIVSISANIANSHFLQFLRDSDMHFPIFDCEDDIGDRRYISYSMVCDFVDHCSNRFDELVCVNPRESLLDNGMYCKSGQKLHSLKYRCDNVKDCRDGSDEENCLGSGCASLRCQDGSCLPLQWLNDGEFDCFIHNDSSYDVFVSDESVSANMLIANNKSCVLICNNHTCINEFQNMDEVTNCAGLEEPLDESVLKLEPANTCRNIFGHFVWAPKCHYFKDRYGGIIGCRDMSHLRGCENFQCDQKFVKCYNSYCIPHRYLRDGKADCPTGEDEQPFYTGPCTGYFACWDSNICCHSDLVCNGRNECPHGDDELDCRVSCPEGFRCILGTAQLSDYNKSVPLNMSSLSAIDSRTRYLDLTGVELYGFDKFVMQNKEVFLLNLKVLILSKCNISELYVPKRHVWGKKRAPLMIQKLDISYNKFVIFSTQGYNYYYKNINYFNISYNRHLKLIRNLRFGVLEIIDLSYTILSYLNESVFEKMPRLKHLNLSHTLIMDFTRRYFRINFTLQTLDLRDIRTEGLDDYSFHGLTISQTLYTHHFQICCPQIQDLVIRSQGCIGPVDVESISSCSDLLGLDTQRFLLWIVAILAIVGNVIVIVYRVIWDSSVLKTGYGLFVTNLGVSDFIMGVYLFMIAGADHFYRGNYVLYDKEWRESVVCKIAGFLACLSCEASTFFIFLITVDRFLLMKFPFGQMKCSRHLRTTAVIMSWVVSFLLSLVPIVFRFDIYSTNSMCLGLPLTNHQAKGWGYSIGIFIICNLIMFLFIGYGQFAIFRAMSEKHISQTTTSASNSRRAREIIVAKQLSLVVLSNFLFWFPVGLMGLMSLGGYEVSSAVYGWSTVLLLPINSAANPILYTIPVLMDQWEKFKHGDQRTLSVSV